MSIFPGKKVQLTDKGVEAEIKGSERIFSKEDTEKIIHMSKSAQSENDLSELGKMVYDAVKRQDTQKPEYTED
jgi:hypothetical protein